MTTTLREAPVGPRLLVTTVDSGAAPVRRLAELGLRPGALIRSLRRTAGGGRILDIGGARVALGYDLVEAIGVEEVR